MAEPDIKRKEKREDRILGFSLFLRFEHLVFSKNRSNGPCRYRPPDKGREFPAIVDMGELETDNEPKAEAGNAD
jgi:hypothetical protein